jgi:predicted nucleic acid-binding protein
MILYLDASALVKRYIVEFGSTEINELIANAQIVGTVTISRAELSATFGKAVRVGILNNEDAWHCLQLFRNEWPDWVRIQVTEDVVYKADKLAWDYQLRGYDSVHLATALIWQEAMGSQVTFVTFDRQLWLAAQHTDMMVS